MSRPQSVVAQMLIPKNIYEFSLNIRDIRLIWATNCGSVSFIDSIPIYRNEIFERQLSDNLRYVSVWPLKYFFGNNALLCADIQWLLSSN